MRLSEKYLRTECPKVYKGFSQSLFYRRPGTLAKRLEEYLDAKGFYCSYIPHYNDYESHVGYTIVLYTKEFTDNPEKRVLGKTRKKDLKKLKSMHLETILNNYAEYLAFLPETKTV